MLQSGSCNCELDSLLSALAGQQAVDQAAAEGVAAANAVDDVQVVLLGEAVLARSNIVQHSAPAVVECAVALTQGDSDLLEVELVSQLLGNALVALSVQLAAVDIGSLGLDAEHVLCVLLVGDADVNVLAQIGHGSAGLLTGPQLAAVVQVAADLHAVSLSSLAGLAADLDNILAQSRGDAGEVEPIHALEDLIPIKVGRLSQLDSAVGTVVDADGTTLRSALLVVVDAHTVTAAGDHAGINAVATQAVDSGLTDSVCGELGNESCVQTVVGQRNSNVSLAAAEGELQAVGLNETLVVEGLQTDHQFAKSNDFHWLFSFISGVSSSRRRAYPVRRGFYGKRGQALMPAPDGRQSRRSRLPCSRQRSCRSSRSCCPDRTSRRAETGGRWRGPRCCSRWRCGHWCRGRASS